MQELGLLQKKGAGRDPRAPGEVCFSVRPVLLVSWCGAPFRSVMLTSFFSFSRATGLKFRPWVSAMAPHWAVWLLAAGLWGLGIGAEMWWNLVPRKTVSSGGEWLKHRRQGQREAGTACWGKGEVGVMLA